MFDQIHISLELIILGFFSSTSLEYLRGLILKIEEYPRLERTWKYYPSILGTILINFFPDIVPTHSLLILLAHGAASPAAAYAAYPLLKKVIASKTQGVLSLPEDKPIAGQLEEKKEEPREPT